MASPPLSVAVSPVDAARAAYHHTRSHLFRIRLEKWLVLGLLGFLDQCGRTFRGGGGSTGGGHGHGTGGPAGAGLRRSRLHRVSFPEAQLDLLGPSQTPTQAPSQSGGRGFDPPAVHQNQ
jgi:hypothetical protein